MNAGCGGQSQGPSSSHSSWSKVTTALRSRLTTFLSVYFQVRVGSCIPEALVCTSCEADACPTVKDPKKEEEVQSREAGVVQPRSDAE